jgi:hypothetical protein
MRAVFSVFLVNALMARPPSPSFFVITPSWGCRTLVNQRQILLQYKKGREYLKTSYAPGSKKTSQTSKARKKNGGGKHNNSDRHHRISKNQCLHTRDYAL